MDHPQLIPAKQKGNKNWFGLIAGFLVLALTYHAGEYAMRFHQHIPLFLGFMLTVVLMAYVVARWQGFRGLSAWGLQSNWRTLSWLMLGLALGLFIYGIAFLVRLRLNIEVISAAPGLPAMVLNTFIFALGTFLPSLAEDILTRGYLYKHLKNSTSGLGFMLISSTVYVLNHLYALDDGATPLIYLFVMGLMLAVALVNTQNLWYTVGVHWAGNIVYRFSNEVMTVQAGTHSFPGLWELTLFVLLLLFINYFCTKSIRENSSVRPL